MSGSLTRIERGGGLAILTLDRPTKRNALSRALREEIAARLDELEADAAVRAVVLTGAPPAFCAGFDREEFDSEHLARGDMERIFADAAEYHRRVYVFSKPLIAAVNGAALGGGCDLAAMCDLRIAATEAVFGQPQVRFGAPALYELLRTVMAEGAAREMCLTGRPCDAGEALSVGLVQRVVEPAALLAEAIGVAREIAALPAGLAEATKRSFLALQPELFGAG